MQITNENIEKIVGRKVENKLIVAFNSIFIKYDKLGVQHFLAQAIHETQSLSRFEENFMYSSERLMEVFPKYFNDSELELFNRKPEKIANRVYANRMGNGDEKSGDGWKYRGRGVFHLTGKANYCEYSEYSGVDFVDNPDLVSSLPYSVLSADWYWRKNKLSTFSGKDDILSISKRINGGLNGYNDRVEWLKKIKNEIV